VFRIPAAQKARGSGVVFHVRSHTRRLAKAFPADTENDSRPLWLLPSPRVEYGDPFPGTAAYHDSKTPIAGAADPKGAVAVNELQFDRARLIDVCRQNDVAMVGVFGSMARGEANKESDIDLVVEFSKRKSLLTLVALERQLSTALGRKVDLLTQAAISPYLRDRIMRDLRVIYDAR
jgi:predicted nucleotidyltransferase